MRTQPESNIERPRNINSLVSGSEIGAAGSVTVAVAAGVGGATGTSVFLVSRLEGGGRAVNQDVREAYPMHVTFAQLFLRQICLLQG